MALRGKLAWIRAMRSLLWLQFLWYSFHGWRVTVQFNSNTTGSTCKYMILLMMASSFSVALCTKLNIRACWTWIHTINLKLSIALLAFLHIFIKITKRSLLLLNTTSTIIERPSFVDLCYLGYAWEFQCKNTLKYSY